MRGLKDVFVSARTAIPKCKYIFDARNSIWVAVGCDSAIVETNRDIYGLPVHCSTSILIRQNVTNFCDRTARNKREK